jgi:hypothetical protein
MHKPNLMRFYLVSIISILVLSILTGCSRNIPTNVCHATEDPANPYQEINVTNVNLREHIGHPNDIIPVPAGGCPTIPVIIVDGKIAICHATSSESNPYNEISVSVNGLNGHAKHEGDLIPAPEGGCPATLVDTSAGKITICHATASDKNPYNEITISVNGLSGHNNHIGDIVPAPEGGCPVTKQ